MLEFLAFLSKLQTLYHDPRKFFPTPMDCPVMLCLELMFPLCQTWVFPAQKI